MAVNRQKVQSAADRALQKGQYRKALVQYKKLCADDPADLKSRLYLGDLYYRVGNSTEGLKAYADAAQSSVAAEELLRAVAIYRHMLRLEPSLHAVHVALARVYDQLGLINDAVSQYQKALTVLVQRGQQLERLRVIRELLELDPQNLRARIRLAEDFLAEGAIEDGTAQLRIAALHLDALGLVDEFLTVADRLLYHTPEDAGIARRVAAIHMQRDAPQHALLRLQACHRASPADTDILNMLADCFQALGQGHKALTVLKEMARIYDRNGLITDRNDALKRVLEIDSSDQHARRVLLGRVGSVPVAEELGFEELSFDENEPSERSNNLNDEYSFSSFDEQSSREPSVSHVEFDDLEALADMVASEPVAPRTLDAQPDETPESGEELAASTSVDGLSQNTSSSDGGSPTIPDDGGDPPKTKSLEAGGSGDRDEPIVTRLEESSVEDEVLDYGSEVIELSSNAFEELPPQTFASLEELVGLVAPDVDSAQSEPIGEPGGLGNEAQDIDRELTGATCDTDGSASPETDSAEGDKSASVDTSELLDKASPADDGRHGSAGQEEPTPLEGATDSASSIEDLVENSADVPNTLMDISHDPASGREDGGSAQTELRSPVERKAAPVTDNTPFELLEPLREFDVYLNEHRVKEARGLLDELLRTYGYRPELLARRSQLEELSE